MFKKIKRVAFYFSLLILGAISGIFLFFPSELAKKYINANQEIIRVEKFALILPLGFHFSNVSVLRSYNIKFSDIYIYPSLLIPISFPLGKADIKILAKTQNTDVKMLTYIIKDQDKFIMKSIKVSGEIEISEIPIEQKFKGKGKVKIIDMQLDNINNIENLSGRINLFSKRITVEVIGLDIFEGEITLGETELVANASSGTINIIKFESKGGDIEGTITGKIKVQKQISDSELDLVLDIKTKIINLPAQKFKLVGKIFQPKISSL